MGRILKGAVFQFYPIPSATFREGSSLVSNASRVQIAWELSRVFFLGILRVSGFFIALGKAYEWYIYGNFCSLKFII